MRFDLSWLDEQLVDAPPADVVAERLTACGFNVELREPDAATEVWDVEVTTNRPDAMNHRGLAREAAVATGTLLKPIENGPSEEGEQAANLVSVEIEVPELCSRYVARVVRNARLVESPAWLAERLERCGVRPLNAIVDATNYVLLELGQPLHAFDLARVAGRRIVVRRAREGETLTTLDGERRDLDPSLLVIADAERPVALAGIMGGADSEIGDETVDVLLESAHFDALTVRRGARKLGMHTEASHRFERGADPEMATTAVDVAAAMIARLAGGTVCRGRVDIYPKPWRPRTLEVSMPRLSAFTGLEIDPAEAHRILDGLGFEPSLDADRVRCTVPSFRVDVERAEDLYEEVIRHVGYDAVPSQLPVLATDPGRRCGSWPLVDRARDAAVSVGLTEVVTYAFSSAEEDEAAARLPLIAGGSLPLANPLTQTQTAMRRSLLPGLLTAARANLNQGETSLALFEEGRVFGADGQAPVEKEHLAIVLAGSFGNWQDRATTSFTDLKGLVDGLIERLAFPAVSWVRDRDSWLEDAEGAVLTAAGGEVVGVAGLVSRTAAKWWDLRQPVYVAELDLSAAMDRSERPRFTELPRFPAITADMTVEHRAELAYGELLRTATELASPLVVSWELVARYSGEGLDPDMVRTTLRAVYRHPERSLLQEEVNAEQEALRSRLAAALDVRFA
ncbi:MAG: phenylalanine--tRNA ligase subunit beta [Acidobacteria bacterium]|nr:phenylalanine--tRNA ligase subunit beta [Acidobacteriota bacterium]